MSFLEINNLIQTIRSIIFAVTYTIWARHAADSGRFAGDAGLVLLGKALFIYIIAVVVIGVALHVLAMVVAVAVDKDARPGEMDERDRLIERRALQHGFAFIGFGFFFAVIALWRGYGAVTGFHVMLAGFTLADITGNLSKFVSYLRQRA